jgi:CheY-like chemotaxis protein
MAGNSALFLVRDGGVLLRDEARPSAGEARMVQARKTTVPCIEDDPETAALVVEDLSDRGFEISVAHNGQEGFVAILKDKPDLVLRDIGVPVMSGFEVPERSNEIAPHLGRTPFVFVTAFVPHCVCAACGLRRIDARFVARMERSAIRGSGAAGETAPHFAPLHAGY